MDANESQAFWELRVAKHEADWKRIWGDNSTTGPLVYWRDVVPYKHLARQARSKAGQSICWGAFDCMDKPLAKCAAGKHETCTKHTNECFLCGAEKA
jgi:hypothetical protein